MASLVQSDMHGAINTDDTKKMDSMSFNSSQRHIRYKIIQQLMKTFISDVELVVKANIFAPCKKTPICIGKKNHFNIPL